jgi:hypothetical protein
MAPWARRLPLALVVPLLVGCSSSSGKGSGDGGPAFKDSGERSHKDAGGGKKDAGEPKDGGKHEDAAHTTSDASDAHGAGEGGEDAGVEASACAPSVQCPVADKSCIGVADNLTESLFGLRMTELSVQKPLALASGLASTTVLGGVLPNLPSCNLQGSGTFSWLLQFNLTESTLTTGGALPVQNPTAGYAFVTATLDGLMVQPVVVTSSLTSGMFTATSGVEVDIPVYLDAAGDSYFVLPIQALTLAGTVSADQDCIGRFNSSALDPANGCRLADGGLAFTPGGTGAGYIILAEADTIEVTPLAESLCVLLSGNPSMYGTSDAGGIAAVCARSADAGITFQGDWCSTTNSAATTSCADSMQLSFGFAAGSVLINGPADAGAADGG